MSCITQIDYMYFEKGEEKTFGVVFLFFVEQATERLSERSRNERETESKSKRKREKTVVDVGGEALQLTATTLLTK